MCQYCTDTLRRKGLESILSENDIPFKYCPVCGNRIELIDFFEEMLYLIRHEVPDDGLEGMELVVEGPRDMGIDLDKPLDMGIDNEINIDKELELLGQPNPKVVDELIQAISEASNEKKE